MGSLKKYYFGKNKSLNKGLVAYYKFDGNSNASVGGINGTNVNSPTFTTGKVGNAINFGNDAILKYCQFVDNDIFSFTDGSGNDIPFSVNMWVNSSSFSANSNYLLNKRLDGISGEEYQIAITATSVQFYKFGNGSGGNFKYFNFSFGLLTNTWYHLVFTDDGTKGMTGMNVYINGIIKNPAISMTGSYSGMSNGLGLIRIGQSAHNTNVNNKHRGLIDELGIWKNRILSQSDVNFLYNSGSGRTYPF